MTTAQQAFNAPEELLPDELFQRDSSLTADADKMTRPSLSYWSDAWRRFKENKVAVISSAILLVIVPVSYTHLDVYKRQPFIPCA